MRPADRIPTSLDMLERRHAGRLALHEVRREEPLLRLAAARAAARRRWRRARSSAGAPSSAAGRSSPRARRRRSRRRRRRRARAGRARRSPWMTPIASRSFAQKSAVGEDEAKSSSVAARPDAASIASTSTSIRSRSGSRPASVSAATRPRRRSSHCGIDSRAVHERDPAMTQLEEVLAGKPAAEDVVDDDRRDVAGRATMVEQDERDAAVGQPLEVALVLARGVDDDPAHALPRQRIERAPLVGQQPVGVADHDRLAVRRGQVLGAAGDLGEERVPDVRARSARRASPARRAAWPRSRSAPSRASTIASRTRTRVDSVTRSGRLTTFETVPTDTPARSATSLIVTAGALPMHQDVVDY